LSVNHNHMEEQRDEKLWQLAKKRADFQNSLLGFVVFTVICWAIWFFTSYRNGDNLETPWPLWVMLGLGISLFLKFMRAYRTDKDTLAEREYERLKNEKK
jgi:type VI protein secretion system component VasK